MNCFVKPTGEYYEGDRAHILDLLVPQRPSPLHKWGFPSSAWLIDTVAQTDATRNQNIDDAINQAQYGNSQPATVAQLKAMSNAEYTAWFDANFTTAAQALGLLKLLTRVTIRRVL